MIESCRPGGAVNGVRTGSTANIIACGMLARRGRAAVRFADWFKLGLPVSLASMASATLLPGAQTGWFHRPAPPALSAGPAVPAAIPSRPE